MNDPAATGPHFKKAVTQLGDRQPVLATQAIVNNLGVKVVDKGVAIHAGLYERLMQHSLSGPIEDSVTSARNVNGASLRVSAEQIIEDVPFFARMVPSDAQRSELLELLENIPLPPPIAFQLTVAHEVRHEIYLQLVRAAITATWLARTPALPRCDPAMAAAAGLLHDIGMLHIDPKILEPDSPLTHEQRRQLYSHPLLSTTLLERHDLYAPEVVRAVGEHQECLDGSGYPRSLSADAISPLGRLLSLAQVVAAMFAPGRSAPEMRLSVLLRMTWHRYDNAMAMQVLSLLRPQLDVMSAELRLLEQPITHLCTIDHLLQQWPLQLHDAAHLTPARVDALAALAPYAAQIRRVLAGVGAVPEQLQLLAHDPLDDALLGELTLLTREACWQLGTLAQQCRRRWRLETGETYPDTLQQWLDAVARLVAAVSGVAPRNPSDGPGPDSPGDST